MTVANVLSIIEHKWFSQTFSAPLYLACMIVFKTDVIIEIQITVIQRGGSPITITYNTVCHYDESHKTRAQY